MGREHRPQIGVHMEKRWKRAERHTAQLLGTHRNPNTGESRADMETAAFAVEHKLRMRLPQWLKHAMWQAVGAAKENQTPIVILTEASRGRKATRYVLMRFPDWLDWHGNTPVTEVKP